MTNPDEVATPHQIRTKLIEPLIQDMISKHLAHISGHAENAVNNSDPREVHKARAHVVELLEQILQLDDLLVSFHTHVGPCAKCGPPPTPDGMERVAPVPGYKLAYPLDCPTCGLYVEAIDKAPLQVDPPWPELTIPNRLIVMRDLHIAQPCGHAIPVRDSDGEIIYKLDKE